jgi:hypothetical protein
MLSLVSRVEKLIALAGSPNENEARTAAWVAVQTIRAHHLRIVDGSYVAPSPPRRAPAPPAPEPVVAKDRRFIIKARFGGFCGGCGVSWSEGDRIAWAKGQRAICVACHQESR